MQYFERGLFSNIHIVVSMLSRVESKLRSKQLPSSIPKLGVARGPLQERPLQFQHGNVCVKSCQPMSSSWSTSSQPDFVRALGRRKAARNRQGKIFVSELLKSWPTLGQFLANHPPHGKLEVFLAVVLWQHPIIWVKITLLQRRASYV